MNLLKTLSGERPVVHSPQLVDLTLSEIVRDGKVSNPYQLFVLGRIATFFKNGLKSADLHLENPVNFESGETSADLKQALASMNSADHVNLASYLLSCISAGECMLHDGQMSTVEWINYVLRRQR